MTRYTIVYSWDEEGAIIARVKELDGCHSYGRSLREAQANILDALRLWIEKPIAQESLEEDWTRVVPLSLARKIEEARVLEEKARQLPQIRAQIASALVARGVSTRDAAWMMGGVSHQRVHQLATVGAKANGPGRNHKKAIRGRRRTGTVRKA